MSSDNGLLHVSLMVSIEDTKHEGLFSLKKLLFFRFTTWSIVGIQDLIALMGLIKETWIGASPQARVVPIKKLWLIGVGINC